MSFNAEDLKRLKERIPHNNLEVYGDKINALLARLEAAEIMIVPQEKFNFCGYCSRWPTHRPDCKYKLWLETTGDYDAC